MLQRNEKGEVNIQFKSSANELEMVEISAGAFEASDENQILISREKVTFLKTGWINK